MGDKCVFCEYADKKLIVCESQNFYVIPTVGQISDGGHLLVIPREHYVCLGAMPEQLFDEFDKLTADVKKAVTEAYEKPIIFEHGILGQSISHAHMQVMPCATDLFSRINRDFKVFRQLQSTKELRELHRTKGVYLFYQNTLDEMFGFILDSHSQYLRIVAAEAVGKPKRSNWLEWRSDEDCAKLDDILIAETVKRLKETN